MKTTSQEKESIHWTITILCISLFLFLKQWKYLKQKQQWTNIRKNWRKYQYDNWRKSETKKKWSMKQGKKAKQCILRHWWIFVISRFRGWNKNIKKCKGRVELWSYFVKDDSDSYAVFTEQDTSASQMTAAKVMDVIARQPGCAGQTADAVSAYIQVKMEDAPWIIIIPKSECPEIWIRLSRHKWPKSWSSTEEDPVVPLERNLYDHSLTRHLWEKQFEKVLLEHGWWKVPNWECSLKNSEKKTILVCACGRHEVGWKETEHRSNLESTHERSRFGWTHIIPWPRLFGLHSTGVRNEQRYCRRLQIHVRIANFRDWSREITTPSKSSCFSAGAKEKLPSAGRPDANIPTWPFDMGGHAEKCVERYCELTNKTTQKLYKVATHQFKEEELGYVGKLSKVYSQIVLTCL